MQDLPNSRIDKDSNLVSRNRPVALVANACTYLASHLIDLLLEKNIQIIAIDDLSISDKRNIDKASKHKDFHLLNFPIDKEEILDSFAKLDLERLDYAFFITSESMPDSILGKGIINFVEIINNYKKSSEIKSDSIRDRPRLVFSSSINLYGKSLASKDRRIQEAEIKFAKGVKHFKLNGRVVRISEVFGPRMPLEGQNPIARLIAATINDNLEDEKVSLVFQERSLYVEDAVKLLVKSALSGSTSNKIFDGTLLHPLKLSEVKQILANQLWADENPPQMTKLPAWPTPNLIKTMKELAWSPKTSIVDSLKDTIAFFKENQDLVPKNEPVKKLSYSKSWSFTGSGFLDGEEAEKKELEKGSDEGNHKTEIEKKELEKKFDLEIKEAEKKSFSGKFKSFIIFIVIAGILGYGIIWPIIFLGYQGWSIKEHLLNSGNHLEKGEFDQAQKEIKEANQNISEFQNFYDSAQIIKKIPKIAQVFEKGERILKLTKEGTEGMYYATKGSKSLFETVKIISGESRENPQKYYEEAQRDLGFASTILSKVYLGLGDESLSSGVPSLVKDRINDLKVRIVFYKSLVEQANSASILLPKITGIGGKKSYLVLLQNNLELRPSGGFIGSYAKLDFENGTLAKIKVDDIYNLDGALKEVIAPPSDLKSDLGADRLYLRDSNYEPDFPTAARQASFFYRKEAGETVHGVLALDLKASGNLLDAVGGLDLPEYGEAVNGTNLFEKAISHAEANFFPGSQAKKNYLTSLQTQLFNKIFYLSKTNYPAIIQAISKSLKEKHMMIYLEDPVIFSHLASSNWSGIFPRGSESKEGETKDFLAAVESNMGANKANFYLQRKITLETSLSKEGKISHKLKINYKNTSPSEVFPAGSYKNRLKIYTPLGSKLIRAQLDSRDFTQSFTPFSDYGRSGFSALIQVPPKQQTTLVFEYELADPLSFQDKKAQYRMEIFKQPGIMSDPLDFILTYPINYKIQERPKEGSFGVQEIKIATDMQFDRVFEFKVTK